MLKTQKIFKSKQFEVNAISDGRTVRIETTFRNAVLIGSKKAGGFAVCELNSHKNLSLTGNKLDGVLWSCQYEKGEV